MTQTSSNSRIDPILRRAVVKISFPPTQHSPQGVGTGFIVGCKGKWVTENEDLLFLITNKHIIGDWTLADGNILETRSQLDVLCYGGAGQFTHVEIPLLDGNGNLLPHRMRLADDPWVDVAAIFLNNVSRPSDSQIPLEWKYFDVDTYLVPFDQITSLEVGLGDQVYALGYLYGYSLADTSYPLVKSGYFATVPGENFALDIPCQARNGMPEGKPKRLEGKLFAVDGLIMPGNSGGPIVLASDLKIRLNPTTKIFETASEKTPNYAIGIVSGGMGISGLTLVYSCDYIIDLVKKFVAELGRPRTSSGDMKWNMT